MSKILSAFLIAMFLLCVAECSFAQVPPIRNNYSGIESELLTSGIKVLCFTKKANRRNIYAVGSSIHIKSASRGKVKGTINIISDTAVMISGLYYKYQDIVAYYIPRSLFRILGSALVIGGGGYILLDGINGVINQHSPIFNVESLSVGIPLIVAGAALLPFKEAKRRTSVWKLRIMEL